MNANTNEILEKLRGKLTTSISDYCNIISNKRFQSLKIRQDKLKHNLKQLADDYNKNIRILEGAAQKVPGLPVNDVNLDKGEYIFYYFLYIQ